MVNLCVFPQLADSCIQQVQKSMHFLINFFLTWLFLDTRIHLNRDWFKFDFFHYGYVYNSSHILFRIHSILCVKEFLIEILGKNFFGILYLCRPTLSIEEKFKIIWMKVPLFSIFFLASDILYKLQTFIGKKNFEIVYIYM